jgi:hypothetical protein
MLFVRGTGFVLRFLFFDGRAARELIQRAERALVFTIQARLKTVQEAEGWASGGEVLEGEGNQLGAGLIAVFLPFALLIDVLVEDAGLDAGEASDAPGDGGELVDEVERGLGAGLEVVDIGPQAGVEFLARFRGEDDGCGGEAVRDGVARRDADSGFGFRPA